MRKLKLKRKINKRIIFLIVINIILLVFGLLYPSLINKTTISTKLTIYIESIVNNKYTLDSIIKTNLINNLTESTSIFLFSLFIISFPISLIIYFTKTFSVGVTISSLLYIYKLKGILYAFFIIIPSVLSIIAISILFYYSLSYFLIMIKYYKRISHKKLLKGYIKVFFITLILQIVISFIDSYISYYLFKLF